MATVLLTVTLISFKSSRESNVYMLVIIIIINTLECTNILQGMQHAKPSYYQEKGEEI